MASEKWVDYFKKFFPKAFVLASLLFGIILTHPMTVKAAFGWASQTVGYGVAGWFSGDCGNCINGQWFPSNTDFISSYYPGTDGFALYDNTNLNDGGEINMNGALVYHQENGGRDNCWIAPYRYGTHFYPGNYVTITTHVVDSCGGGGGYNAHYEVVRNTPVPSLSCAASPSIINLGSGSTLSWYATPYSTVYVYGVGTYGYTGGANVYPESTTTYTFQAVNEYGNSSYCYATVYVAPPSVSFSASPAAIDLGQSSTLFWSSTNATSLSITSSTGVVNQTVGTSGTLTVTPQVTTTYYLSASSSSGSTSAQTAVTINPPTAKLSANPDLIDPGGSSTLTWSSTSGTSATIQPTVGSVSLSGSTTVQPPAPTTYTLTVVGPSGTATAQATVTIRPPDVTFSASPTRVNLGESSTLTWSVKFATSVSISPDIGSVGATGTQDVKPQKTITYTLTATGPGGTTVKTVTITIPPPTIIFTANPPTIINSGDTVTLTWTSLNATSVVSSNFGATTVSGSTTVQPHTATSYTIVLAGPSGQVTGQLVVDVVKTVPIFFNGSFVAPTIQLNKNGQMNINLDPRVQKNPPPGFTEVVPPVTKEGS